MPNLLIVHNDSDWPLQMEQTLQAIDWDWNISYCSQAQEALDISTQKQIDIILCDSGAKGVESDYLLCEIIDHHPGIIRIVMINSGESTALAGNTTVTHQYLLKPVSPDDIRQAVTRAYRLNSLMESSELKSVVSGIKTLPSLPSIYYSLQKEARSDNPSIRRVAEIMSSDVSMTAKVLQLANSAYFGQSRHISDPASAVSLLGLNMITSLSLCANMFSHYDQEAVRMLGLSSITDHSFKTAAAARELTKMMKLDREEAENAFIAGVLHDIGVLVLAADCPEKYRQAIALSAMRKIPMQDAEANIFGATHAEVGAYLLGLWGLAPALVEATAYHHRPQDSGAETCNLLTAVHIADAICDKTQWLEPDDAESKLSRTYLEKLNLTGQVSEWLDALSDLNNAA